MAYTFNGSQGYYGTNPVTAMPMTLACWGKTSDTSANTIVICTGSNLNSDYYFALAFRGARAGDPIGALEIPSAAADTSTGYSANVRCHAVAILAGHSSRSAFINGGSKTTTTTTGTMTDALSWISIGYGKTSINQNFFNGEISEAAIWDAALSDDEIMSLAKGFSPRRVRPQSLVFYAPLVRAIHDIRKGIALTAVGTPSVANHPRVY